MRLELMSMKQNNSFLWKSANLPNPRKTNAICSEVKTVFIVLFDYNSSVHGFVPAGQAVNQD
jgi:hypothetical protein